MTLAQFKQAFADKHPMAVDFPEKEYRRQEVEVSMLAQAAGYRFAGVRQGRAVFTTKERPRAPDAPDGQLTSPSPVEPGS